MDNTKVVNDVFFGQSLLEPADQKYRHFSGNSDSGYWSSATTDQYHEDMDVSTSIPGIPIPSPIPEETILPMNENWGDYSFGFSPPRIPENQPPEDILEQLVSIILLCGI